MYCKSLLSGCFKLWNVALYRIVEFYISKNIALISQIYKTNFTRYPHTLIDAVLTTIWWLKRTNVITNSIKTVVIQCSSLQSDIYWLLQWNCSPSIRHPDRPDIYSSFCPYIITVCPLRLDWFVPHVGNTRLLVVIVRVKINVKSSSSLECPYVTLTFVIFSSASNE